MPRVQAFEDNLSLDTVPEGNLEFHNAGLLINASNKGVLSNESTLKEGNFFGHVVGHSVIEGKEYHELNTQEFGNFACYGRIFIENGEAYVFAYHFNDGEMSYCSIPTILSDNNDRLESAVCFTEKYYVYTLKTWRGDVSTYIHDRITDTLANIIFGYGIFHNKCSSDALFGYQQGKDSVYILNFPSQYDLFYAGSDVCMCLNTSCFLVFDWGANMLKSISIMYCREAEPIDLTERFPTLLQLPKFIADQCVIKQLSENDLSIIFFGKDSAFSVNIHDSEMVTNIGSHYCSNICCQNPKLFDVEDFQHFSPNLWGEEVYSKKFGRIEWRLESEIALRMRKLQFTSQNFDFQLNFREGNQSVHFFFDLNTVIVLKGHGGSFFDKKNVLKLDSLSYRDGVFFGFAENIVNGLLKNISRLEWTDSALPRIVEMENGHGYTDRIIFGWPMSTESLGQGVRNIWLGDSVIMQLPAGDHITNVVELEGSMLVIMTTLALCFVQLEIESNHVTVSAVHRVGRRPRLRYVFAPTSLTREGTHQLFASYPVSSADNIGARICCINLETGELLNPYVCDSECEGRIDFLTGSTVMFDKHKIFYVKIRTDELECTLFNSDDLFRRHICTRGNLVRKTIIDENERMFRFFTYDLNDEEFGDPQVVEYHLPTFLAGATFLHFEMPEPVNEDPVVVGCEWR
ncbi:hypothetical protein PCE1_000513 [Barthelona sp. PCE]